MFDYLLPYSEFALYIYFNYLENQTPNTLNNCSFHYLFLSKSI